MPSTISERRRAQNRIAQQKFRRKKQQEQQSASERQQSETSPGVDETHAHAFPSPSLHPDQPEIFHTAAHDLDEVSSPIPDTSDFSASNLADIMTLPSSYHDDMAVGLLVTPTLSYASTSSAVNDRDTFAPPASHQYMHDILRSHRDSLSYPSLSSLESGYTAVQPTGCTSCVNPGGFPTQVPSQLHAAPFDVTHCPAPLSGAVDFQPTPVSLAKPHPNKEPMGVKRKDVKRPSKRMPPEVRRDSLTRTGGKSPLHVAAENGHFNVVQILLQQGADTDEQDTSGSTALHLATRYRHLDVLRLLLERGADVDMVDQSGWTSLHYAAGSGFEDGLRLLITHGANVHGRLTDDGESEETEG